MTEPDPSLPPASSPVARHVAVLRRVAVAVSRSLDLEEVVEKSLAALTEVTGHEIASLHLLSADGRTLFLRGARGMSAGLREVNRVLPVGQGLIGTVASRGRPVVLDEVLASTELLPAARQAVATDRIRCFVCVPIRARDQILGTLSLGRQTPDRFSEEEVALLESAADQIGLALDNARLYSEIQRQLEDLRRTQAELVQAEKLSTLGKLTAGVAHELNSPLSVVTLETALLRQAVGSGPLAGHADRILQAAERCARTVRNFLVLARQHRPEREEVELNHVVREAVELLAYPLREANVETRLALTPDLPTLWADPNQLHQVVVNLITNAHQAMREHPAPRRLSVATRSDPARGRVVLEVADTGPGIPPEIQGRIFEPFFTTKATGQGTGLGLSLCLGIIEGHGGTIGVESLPRGGAVFRIELPVNAPPATETEAAAVDTAPPLRGKAILVVDDEPGVAAALADLLRLDDHDVETAANGARALDKLRARGYDLILSDIKMPELDGPGLYRELARRYPGLRKRVIFFTGDMLNPTTAAFLEETGLPSLTKPFDMDEVRQAVQRALRAHEQG